MACRRILSRSFRQLRKQVLTDPGRLTQRARTALPLASGVMLVLALPPADIGWLAWVALVPLIIACHDTPVRWSFAYGFLFGTVSVTGTYSWMLEIPAFGPAAAIILTGYLSLYPALWCAGLSLAARSRLPVLVSAPALWVVLEHARGHAGFLALPWATLAHTQHENIPLLQSANVAGEAGITFLLVMLNVLVAHCILGLVSGRRFAVVTLLVTVVHVLGWLALDAPRDGAFRVAAVQPAVTIAERGNMSVKRGRLERLTRAVASGSPGLVVWPESAVRGVATDPELIAWLMGLSREVNAPIALGSSATAKFRSHTLPPRGSPKTFNSVLLVRPTREIQGPYHKTRLVPFAEYLPMAPWFRWPRWLVPGTHDMVRGNGYAGFTLGEGIAFSALICWESAFADIARRQVQDGSGLLLNLTNDNWFGESAQSRQHALTAVLRAVENRVPVVVASNTGPSLVIDRYGRVLASAPLLAEASAIANVDPRTGGTVYTAHGDYLAALAALWLLLCVVLQLPAVPGGARRRFRYTGIEHSITLEQEVEP